MQKSHSIARVVLVGTAALASLIAVAASAAVFTDAPRAIPAAHIDWQAITDTANQRFFFN